MSESGPYEALKYRIRQMEEIKTSLGEVLDDFLQSKFGQRYEWAGGKHRRIDHSQLHTGHSVRSKNPEADTKSMLNIRINAHGAVELSLEYANIDEEGWHHEIVEDTLTFQADENPDFVVADTVSRLACLCADDLAPQFSLFLEAKMNGTRPAPDSRPMGILQIDLD